MSNLLRKILVSKREDAKGGWRKLYNEDLHYLYSCANIRVTKLKQG
jgi:hypothetical protein